MTMMTCKLPPVTSNDLLREFFDKGRPFYDDYTMARIQKLDCPLQTQVRIKGKDQNGYLIPLRKVMLIEAWTGCKY